MYKVILLTFSALFLFACGSADVMTNEKVDLKADSQVPAGYYRNEKFGFQCRILPNFEVEYLPDDGGIVMKRQAEAEFKTLNEQYLDHYEVYISVSAYENFEKFEDLSDMLAKKYADFTQVFAGDGVFVNELSDKTALSHYFMMSEDGKIIYEALLKVPGFHYKNHKKGYEDFAATFKVL